MALRVQEPGRVSAADPVFGPTRTDAFQRIIKFLVSFVQKDKQSEGLIEKLCHRFRGTTEMQQWRDISYCLSVLNYPGDSSAHFATAHVSHGDHAPCQPIPLREQLQYVLTSCTGAADRGTKKIVELFKCYSDNLGDEAVWSSFQSVIVKVTDTTPRPRAAIDSSAHPLAVVHLHFPPRF